MAARTNGSHASRKVSDVHASSTLSSRSGRQLFMGPVYRRVTTDGAMAEEESALQLIAAWIT